MVGLPSWSGAAHVRNISSTALSWTYQLRIHGSHHIGTSGALVIVCPSEAVLAGALVQAIAPRPVHVMANAAMRAVLPARALTMAGSLVPEGRTAVAAQRLALDSLQDGRAVAFLGSLVNPAWLVAESAAPVVCVTLVGEQGRVPTDPPRIRSLIHAFVSPPTVIRVQADGTTGDPLRAGTRAAVAERIRQVVADAGEQALTRAGLWEAS